MTKVKFIHASDLHLDTPFKGLSNWNSQLASKLKEATFKSFKNIIDLCLQEKVDFLLISGDIFDSENKSLAAQLKFVHELKRLSEKGIPTYFICGNHDPLSSWLESLQMPKNVFRFNSTEVEKFTYQKSDKPIADIYGISFENKVVNKNLARNYQLNSNTSAISIAILHGTVGTPGPHENYAPFKVEDVTGKGFDYWALGHIHKRQIIQEKNPTIVYPGNPQGRDFGETGKKGCYIVEIAQNEKPKIKFASTQLISFEEIEIDLTEEDKIGKLPDRIEDAKTNIDNYEVNTSYILRITFKGRTSLHSQFNKQEEIEQLLEHFNDGQLNQKSFTWIDGIGVKTQPDLDIEQIKKESGFTAEILKSFGKLESNPGKLDEVIKNADKNFSSYPAKREIKIADDEHNEILEKAKWMLFDQLIKGQE